MITAQEVREIQRPIIEEYELEQSKKMERVIEDILPIIEEEILKATITQSITISIPTSDNCYEISNKRIKYKDEILQGFGIQTIMEAITPHLEENGYVVTFSTNQFVNRDLWWISWKERK